MNEALRAHVTRVGFDLSLARSHIAALVWLDHNIKSDKGGKVWRDRGWVGRPAFTHPLSRVFGLFAGGAHGLEQRGLIIHTHPDTIKLPKGVKHSSELPASRIWRITTAGQLVIALLKETGIYQEYAEALAIPRVVEETG